MDANPFGDDATRQCHHQFGSLTDNPFGGGVDASGHHQSEEVREDRGSKLAYVRGHAAAPHTHAHAHCPPRRGVLRRLTPHWRNEKRCWPPVNRHACVAGWLLARHISWGGPPP